jgi:hypothetical protein
MESLNRAIVRFAPAIRVGWIVIAVLLAACNNPSDGGGGGPGY